MLPPSQVSLFKGIDDPAFVTRLSELPSRKMPKGMVIFEQGETGSEIFGILSGSLEILHRNQDGDFVRVAILKAGEIFGEFSILTGSPRTTSAVAMEEVTLLEIGSAWLTPVSVQFPLIMDRLNDLYRTRILTNILRATRIFAPLSDEQIKQLAMQVTPKKAPDGEILIREGATADDLLIIKRGRVAITKQQGTQTVSLGELGAGDVLGEMALVTGEPRSASATCIGATEYLVISGVLFKTILHAVPKILKTIEDIIRSRSEQTRRSLEAVVDEIVGNQWEGTEGDDLPVASLQLGVTFEAGSVKGEGKLLSVSARRWTLERRGPLAQLLPGSPIKLTLSPGRLKELKDWSKETLAGVTSETDGESLPVILEADATLLPRLTSLVTTLARARVRAFVYPSYDTESMDLILEAQFKGRPPLSGRLSSVSQTQGRLKSEGTWIPGEFASIRISRMGAALLSARALCLAAEDGVIELQFEYDSGEERSALENMIREIARSQGYGGARAATAPAVGTATIEPVPRSAPVLERHFPNPQEFVKAYLSSMERGFLKLDSVSRLSPGLAVKARITVADGAGTRRITCGGSVRAWKDGKAEITLDDRSGQLAERLKQICTSLVDRHSEGQWEDRKRQLGAGGGRAAPSTNWTLVGLATAGLALVTFLGMRFFMSPTSTTPPPAVPGHVSSPAVVREEVRIPSRQVGSVPRRSSTKAEKMNVSEEAPTKEFIESQKKEMLEGLQRQLAAARLSLKAETDPKKITEMQERVRIAEQAKADLDAVDPNNAATWGLQTPERSRE